MSNKLASRSKAIQDKVNQLEQVVIKLQAQAKENLAKAQAVKGSTKQMYKQRAIMALTKKKQYQNQIKGYMNQQMTLDKAQFTSQSMKNHGQMMAMMQQANNQQKNHMKKLDIDKMADLQDQMMDMKFEADYMNQMMNQNYDVDVDEDEMDDELMEFEREIAREKKNTNKPISQPTNNNQQPNYKNQDINSYLK